MNQEAQSQISTRRLVYEIPGMETTIVRRDVEYCVTATGPLTMDLYYPPDTKAGSRTPAVVLVSGYSDDMVQSAFGCKGKEMGAAVSKGRLAAASGLVAIAYETRDPATDAPAVLEHVRANAESLGVDEDRIGLWAASGNAPMALSLLMENPRDYCRCAVLCYGFMLDGDESTVVADASAAFGFVNPCAGKSVKDLSSETPLLVVRAGMDGFPHLNDTIDRFIAAALACNLPVVLANHSGAPHAFDLSDDGYRSREVIRLMLAFLRSHLLAERP